MSTQRTPMSYKAPEIITLSDDEQTIMDPQPMKKIRRMMTKREIKSESQPPFQPSYFNETPKRRRQLSTKEQQRLSEFTPTSVSEVSGKLKTFTFFKNGRLDVQLCDTCMNTNRQQTIGMNNENFHLDVLICGDCAMAASKNSYSSYMIHMKNLFDENKTESD